MDIIDKILQKSKQAENTKEIIKKSDSNLIDTLRSENEKLNKKLLECKDKIIELQEELLDVRTSERNTLRNEVKANKRKSKNKICND